MAIILKPLLLLINSIVFIMGCFIFMAGIVEVINLRTNEFEYNLEEEAQKLQLLNATHSANFTAVIEDRFPSTGAPSVILIFGLITIIVSALGITAVNKEKVKLLSVYSIILVIALSIRVVFIFATVCMYAFTSDLNPIRVTTVLSGAIATVELILVVCVCRFAKSIKRGEHLSVQTVPDSQHTDS